MAMTRREALAALGLAVAGAPAVLRGRYRLFAQPAADYSARAIRLVQGATVVDLLNQFQFPDFSVKPPSSRSAPATPVPARTGRSPRTRHGSTAPAPCSDTAVWNQARTAR